MWMRGCWSSSVTFAGMIMAVMAQASSMVVNKLAMSGGTNKFVLVFYCNSLSTFLFLPCLLLLCRPSCPSLTSSLLIRIFFLSMIGFSAQISGFMGIDYSSPMLGTALMNLIPAFTFILAIIFRMEKLVWKSLSSQAKVVGTIASIAGAFIVTFYKGEPLLKTPKLHLPLPSGWVVGGFFLAGEAFLISLCYIVQAFIFEDYPVLLIIMFFFNFFLAILAGLLSLVAVRDPESWALKADSGLVAVVYLAMAGNAFRVTVTAWCVKRRGPVYVAMFKPLGLLCAVVLGIAFLGDQLCRGSLIGAMVIVGGFYVVMWGKAKEDNASDGQNLPDSLPQTSHKTPLLAAADRSREAR